MDQESFTTTKSGGATATATARRASSRAPRGRRIYNNFNNLKITILCGFVNILVLRGTINVENLGGGTSPDSDAEANALETERILTNRDLIRW